MNRHAIFALLLLFITSASVKAEDSEVAQPLATEPSVGQFHPHCLDSFRALPIDSSGKAFDEKTNGTKVEVKEQDLVNHFIKYRERYAQYDQDCFEGWNDLSEMTRDFLAYNVGVLFLEEGNQKLSPVCTAFRISNSMIVTASHCLTRAIGLMQFRLYGDPERPLKVIPPGTSQWLEYVSHGGIDLKDYAMLQIEESPFPSRWTRESFTRDVKPHQSIAVIAISIPAFYVVQGAQLSHWINAVRFSRANGSQVWDVDSLEPSLNSQLRAECILHRAPTYPGMSGAPIIGVRLQTSSSGKPRLYVMGIHLRNGPRSAGGSAVKDVCGNFPQFNVGIRIPPTVIDAVGQ
ncbi:serine protease [Microvirga terrae]|uniref:Serine protease n=1 Tax=Microvirga terrae TaxID=2740529 RepID=A0ABY5RNK3_9HYPH|nr:trypsin-like peptidase domain-containing protein [Microvirga terrae]UVF18826.1 serine protease [Microvirga terrae]